MGVIQNAKIGKQTFGKFRPFPKPILENDMFSGSCLYLKFLMNLQKTTLTPSEKFMYLQFMKNV